MARRSMMSDGSSVGLPYTWERNPNSAYFSACVMPDFASFNLTRHVAKVPDEELEKALAMVFSRFGPGPILTVAGRTDAGVHALDQVAEPRRKSASGGLRVTP